jgi:hypothetical protein
MSTSRRRLVRTGLATAGLTSLLLAVTVAPADAAALAMTLSSVSGPSGGGNTITGTTVASAANPGPFSAGSLPTIQLQYVGTGSTACTAMAKNVTPIAATGAVSTAGVLTVNPEDVKRIAANKIAFRVPQSAYPATVDDEPSQVNPTGLVLAGTQTTAKWNICVYDGPSTTASTLLANAPYTLAARPKISAILPASSPAFGGQTITVTGAGFGAAANSTTASIGGVTLTNIKVATNGNSFTAVTPPRAAAPNLVLTVNTPGGPVTSNDPDNNGQPTDDVAETPDTPIYFTYSNGVTITPATAPSGTSVDVDIKGVGFSALTFKPSAAPADPTAHVFLVSNAYIAASNRGVQECKRVLVASNTELICTLDLLGDRLNPADSTATSGPTPEGTYTLTVVANGAPDAADAANPTIVSSGSTFTVGPY